MTLYKGYPAYSSDEIERIKKNEGGGPDVMLIGMNPSFSASIFTQLRKNNQEQFDEFFLDLRRELLINSDDLRKDEIAGALTDDQLRILFQHDSPDNDPRKEKREKVLRELQYFFLNGRKKEGVLEWMRTDSGVRTISYFDSIRKTLRPLDNDPKWYHEDLVHTRETDQKELVKTQSDKSWEEDIKRCWGRINLVNPKVLLIANSKVAEKLFSNWDEIYKSNPGQALASPEKQYPSQRELKWQGEPNFRLCVNPSEDQRHPDSWHGPVVFSRQLSGGCSKAMMHYCLRDLYGSLHSVSEPK